MQNKYLSFSYVALFFAGMLVTLSASFCMAAKSVQKLEQGITDGVVQMVKKKALAPPSIIKSSDLITKDLLGETITVAQVLSYLHSFDSWASLTLSTHNTAPSLIKNGGSVGMALVQNRKNQIVCIPYPHGPAARAGIIEGDILMGIDSLHEAKKHFSGPVGHPLTLVIDRGHSSHTYTLIREKFSPPHVDLVQHEGFARIRIWYFDRNTPQFFVEKVQQAGQQPLVIDLRGNSGGNILAARTCAAEFLSQNTLLGISMVRENENTSLTRKKHISAHNNGKFLDSASLIIWQDTLTASAAEAFLVALIDNDRAISIGDTTFGKAFAQSTFSVHGQKLSLSTEALLRLNGESWEGRGIEPTLRYENDLQMLIHITQEQIFMGQ